MITENYFLFPWKTFYKKAKYIIVITPEAANDGDDSWQGRLHQLKNFLEESATEHTQSLQRLDKNIERIFATSVEDRMRPLEIKINHRLATIEQRIIAIIGKLMTK